MKLISVVTPCFNEQDNILELYDRVKSVFNKQLKNYTYEHIFIDNSSTDKSIEIIKEIIESDKNVKLIVNSRNFGHMRSPVHGMFQASGDVIISLVSDLQDPPEMIPRLIDEWEKGSDIVLAIKETSKENAFMFKLRKIYYRILNKLSEIEIFENFTGFGLYTKQVMYSIKQLDDPYPFFRGMVAEVGFNVTKIDYDQPVRKKGITKNNFYTLYDIGILGIISNSKIPLRLAIFLGGGFGIISFSVGVLYLVLKIMFWDTFSVGIAPIIILLAFMFSVFLFFIGLIG